jgi:predicted GNAT family acetyltransferase
MLVASVDAGEARYNSASYARAIRSFSCDRITMQDAGDRPSGSTMTHPLDRPIWHALNSRQAGLAQMHAGIRRYAPAFAPFAATADGSPKSFAQLAALVPAGGRVVLQQDGAMEPPPGLVSVLFAATVQMVAEHMQGADDDFQFEVLGADDAPAMRALAELTKPGPFSERTHELGRFVGIRHHGQLVAMAGERMKLDGYTEISGVCTHPDHRGKHYADRLMREVGRGIVARGETPFLHAFADNASAIALYERLGFVTRWRPMLLVLARR